jgi:hypothetical protein
MLTFICRMWKIRLYAVFQTRCSSIRKNDWYLKRWGLFSFYLCICITNLVRFIQRVLKCKYSAQLLSLCFFLLCLPHTLRPTDCMWPAMSLAYPVTVVTCVVLFWRILPFMIFTLDSIMESKRKYESGNDARQSAFPYLRQSHNILSSSNADSTEEHTPRVWRGSTVSAFHSRCSRKSAMRREGCVMKQTGRRTFHWLASVPKQGGRSHTFCFHLKSRSWWGLVATERALPGRCAPSGDCF